MKVWITYAYDDKEFVERLKVILKKSDFEVLDTEQQVLPGDNIVESIYKSISLADIIFVILSKASNERKWFSTELGLIISEIRKNSNKKIIPILKDKVSEIPPFINQYQYLDLSDGKDFDQQFDKLIKSIKDRHEPQINFQELDERQEELVMSHMKLLEQEKYLYENQKKQKQRILTVTILTTLIVAFTTLFGFIASLSKTDIFHIDLKNINSTVFVFLIGIFLGVVVSYLLTILKKK